LYYAMTQRYFQMFFGVQERKKKKNEISFLHFIVFLKEEIKKGKKQINISQALKY